MAELQAHRQHVVVRDAVVAAQDPPLEAQLPELVQEDLEVDHGHLFHHDLSLAFLHDQHLYHHAVRSLLGLYHLCLSYHQAPLYC